MGHGSPTFLKNGKERRRQRWLRHPGHKETPRWSLFLAKTNSAMAIRHSTLHLVKRGTYLRGSFRQPATVYWCLSTRGFGFGLMSEKKGQESCADNDRKRPKARRRPSRFPSGHLQKKRTDRDFHPVPSQPYEAEVAKWSDQGRKCSNWYPISKWNETTLSP